MAKFDFISLSYGKMKKKKVIFNQLKIPSYDNMYNFSSKYRYTENRNLIWKNNNEKNHIIHILIYVYYVKYKLKYIYKIIFNYYPV